MTILVTGAKGNLGKQIVALLEERGFGVATYSHTQNLADVSWQKIDTVINCAAAVPRENTPNEQYFEANVRFVEEIIKFCTGKRFIHFSTLSQLYKHDSYQRSKLIGDSLLLINKHLFKDLQLIHLPTIEDGQLIDAICRKAMAGEMPKVDHLKYNFMSFEDIAKYTVDSLNGDFYSPIFELFKSKDLYSEVSARVSSELIEEGEIVDRILISERRFYFHPNLANEF